MRLRTTPYLVRLRWRPITVNMTGLGEPERLQGARVSWNYFDLLGVGMTHGRAFVEADDQGDGNRIVLSYGAVDSVAART